MDLALVLWKAQLFSLSLNAKVPHPHLVLRFLCWERLKRMALFHSSVSNSSSVSCSKEAAFFLECVQKGGEMGRKMLSGSWPDGGSCFQCFISPSAFDLPASSVSSYWSPVCFSPPTIANMTGHVMRARTPRLLWMWAEFQSLPFLGAQAQPRWHASCFLISLSSGFLAGVSLDGLPWTLFPGQEHLFAAPRSFTKAGPPFPTWSLTSIQEHLSHCKRSGFPCLSSESQ